ncbi:cobaltochelatase subunit CobN [Desulfosarcina ovata]|uniref:Protoporphyrin IX magnesium chelatase n=1 Tax=Desulfosarcina ovata subsp. ovata TaxID=2752305 RepID=A0A5K8AJ10_9BACT|nr:cobaltochelatase subunit CobN [Desulfosarcina ovata]BBO92486.1 protoporphyrin IX magnesium chelatase [Desulfosarcina ovata subsp. ovata]
MKIEKRIIEFFISICIITLLLLPVSAGASPPTTIAFIIPETSTKVMAEGISAFDKAYPALAEKVNIVVYPGKDLEEKTVEPDMTVPDIIFLYHIGYKVMLDLENPLKLARARGAKVIGIGGYDIFRAKGYYNVDLSAHPNMEVYWHHGGPENVKRLIACLLNELSGMADIAVEPPVETPLEGIYHPDAPGSKIFDSLEEYHKWYREAGHLKDAAWAGLLAYNTLKVGDNKIEDAIIRQLEKEGINVICAIGYPAAKMFQHYFLKDGVPQIDIVVSLMFSHPKEKSVALLENANIPVIRAISLYNEVTEWEKKPQGITPVQLASQIFLPEMSGLIEPTVVGGKRIFFDERTGMKITERVPVAERIEKVVKRTKAWLRLKHLANDQKKIAVLYYNHHTGKQNLGASYLDLFASLKVLLDSLGKAGYNLGENVSLTQETLKEMIMMQGRNISTKAPGELKKMVDTGKLVMIPVADYKKWYNELPQAFRTGVEEKWGTVDQTTLMTWGDKAKQEKYIIIPGLILGNLFIGPQPTRGWLEEADHLYHDITLPPHHQYLAFYLWLKHAFNTDAVIHFGKHGTLEWTPGKQAGLSETCAPDVLMQDIPDIYPYLMDDVGEGTQAKRRGYGVIVDHMIPGIRMSGLYKEYAKINELIPLYEQAKDQTPAVAEKYQEEILQLTDTLGIGKDIGVELNKDHFDELLDVLHDYLAEIRSASMPYGLHTLGVPLTGESLVSMVMAMLAVETDIPALDEIVAGIQKLDLKKMKQKPGKYIKEMEAIDTVSEVLLSKAILEKTPLEKIFSESLGKHYAAASPRQKVWLKQIIQRGIGYATSLGQCDQEIKSILNALNAGYVLPGPGNDPIRDPEALPTGRNFYGFNPEKVPTQAAWKVGKKLADDLIQGYLKKNGRYPHKTALVLWATETLRHHGVMESKALYLMGARPIWDGRGYVKGVELIPESELKRPRIDILVSASGLYRDVFPIQIGLIDDAVQMIIKAEDEKYENFVRLHTLETEQVFKEQGYTEKEAAEYARFRIFGAPNQGYGTGLNEAIPASGTWEKDDKLADLYINRMNYAYGRNVWGKKSQDAFKQALKGTDMVVHSRSTNLFGVVDNDDVYQYMGGLAMAVRNVSGETPDLFIADAKNPSDPKMVDFAKALGLEVRARNFNPKWIEGMQKNGYSGAREMAKFAENLWGWQVVTPDEVSKEMWEQTYQVYVADKYGMKLKEFFEKNSPHALQSITARIMEVERKEYQKFDEQMLRKVAVDYVESVARQGMACCEHTCNNIAMNQFAANILSVPGLVSPATMLKFQQQVKLATGKDVRTPEWVKKAETKETKSAKAPDEAAGEAGTQKAEEVKGYELKEKKEEKATEISSSGASLAAVLLVVAIVAVIGRGFWKGMKRR